MKRTYLLALSIAIISTLGLIVILQSYHIIDISYPMLEKELNKPANMQADKDRHSPALSELAMTVKLLLNEMRNINQNQADIKSSLDKILLGEAPTNVKEDTLKSGNKPIPDNSIQQQSLENFTSALELAVETEEIDQQWAENIGDRISTVATNTLYKDSNILTVTCRSSMCKITVAHQTLIAEKHFNNSFMRDAGFHNSDALYTRDVNENGGVDATIYISRNGYGLPGKPIN